MILWYSSGMKRTWIIRGGILAAVVVVVVILLRGGPSSGGGPSGELYAPVARGPLVINLEESGEVKPSQQITIKSDVEGNPRIIYIVPEGSIVKEGDLLVELDTADKVDQKVNQEIEVENAESGYTLKVEDLEIAKNQAASDNELAEQDLAFAKDDLVKYTEGEYPTKLSEAKGNVALAEQELERAKEKYDWSKKLFEEDFLSESELKSDELSWKHQELSLETSRGNLALLENYTHKRELAKLESDVRQKEAALDRTLRRSKSSIIQAESALRAKKSELDRQKQKLEKIEEQIAKSKIYAPMAGQVIYSTSNQRPWENNEPLKEGVEVWQRRDLIYLPTADTFIATFNIHESALSGVTTGMPVRVRCDALPDKVYPGRITRISPMADTGRRWMNPDLKEYPAEVLVEGGVGELKSGMSCRIEILLAQYADALSVPVQAIVRTKGVPSVWVRTPRGPERREIEIGLDNNRFAHVLSGVTEKDEVLLAPPLEGSEEGKEREPMPDDASVPEPRP